MKRARMPPSEASPFVIKDCALIALATGRKAQNLKEFREQLLGVDASSLYYHFWGGLLHPGFEEREYGNDFAEWVRQNLHDLQLAERLAVIDPCDFADLEALRQEMFDVVEERLDEVEALPWVPVDRQFQFIRSQIVVFNTHRIVDQPQQLATLIPELSPSSIYYHFIDARQRSPHAEDDFRKWLSVWGDRYGELRQSLAEIDPYFTTLYELRNEVATMFAEFFGGHV